MVAKRGARAFHQAEQLYSVAMTEKIIAILAHFIIATISATGYLGVALLMGIESACIPLPSEIIMPFSGYLVYTGRFQLLWVATAGALGCNLGVGSSLLGGSPMEAARWSSVSAATYCSAATTWIARPSFS